MNNTFSFQQIAAPKVLSAEVREAISNNVLQFYVRDQQQDTQDEGITALYERLSQEDKLEGESNSIANQKKILERYCREHGITAYRHYDEDDGYSGTNFNRPGFQRMLADIKAGKIKRVIVKDMSRFGRDYLQVGFYTDMLFPDFGVHFIAVNDGVDSTRGENEFTAIRNVFNEMYARDTSKKIRATWQSKGKSGEHLTTIPPYGYMKDPDNKKKWIIDEEAAAVVQQIFALCVSGMGPTQIAKWLEKHEIYNPTAYSQAKGRPVTNKPTANPYKWTNETVSRTLERIEYLGHTVKHTAADCGRKRIPHCAEHTPITPPPYQNGRYGYFLRAALLCRVWRQDVSMPSNELYRGTEVFYLFNLSERQRFVYDPFHKKCCPA